MDARIRADAKPCGGGGFCSYRHVFSFGGLSLTSLCAFVTWRQQQVSVGRRTGGRCGSRSTKFCLESAQFGLVSTEFGSSQCSAEVGHKWARFNKWTGFVHVCGWKLRPNLGAGFDQDGFGRISVGFEQARLGVAHCPARFGHVWGMLVTHLGRVRLYSGWPRPSRPNSDWSQPTQSLVRPLWGLFRLSRVRSNLRWVRPNPT